MSLRHVFALIFTVFLTAPAFASLTSFRNAHPVAWMHLLPVGETPGWSSGHWWNLELNHANIWNRKFSMTDKRTGDIYTYGADFEQSSGILDVGFAVLPRMALSFEVPYAYRNGGIFDSFIDQFHVAIGSNRFMREVNHEYANEFIVQKNGEDSIATSRGEGLGSFRSKLKFWLAQWTSPTPGVCDCGFSTSFSAKWPVQKRTNSLTSGTADFSGAVHLGIPLGSYSGVWATAAWTKLGRNDTFAGWPRHDWQKMYELHMDFGIGPSFGVFLQARAESPLFDKRQLEFNYTSTNENSQIVERVASGWNSLVYWRGSQAGGFRWRWGQGSRVNLMLVEDWGIGNKDRRRDSLYVNNAPDIALISQFHFVF